MGRDCGTPCGCMAFQPRVVGPLLDQSGGLLVGTSGRCCELGAKLGMLNTVPEGYPKVL